MVDTQSQLPVHVGDIVAYARFRRRVIAVNEPGRHSQGVCIEVFPEDNVWGGWISVPDVPGSMGARVVERTRCPSTP